MDGIKSFTFGQPWCDEPRDIPWVPGFVANYLRYVKDTEPAPIHHLACAITLASVAVGGASWVAYGSKKVSMLLYTSLMAPTGHRKTEAILLAMPVFRKAQEAVPGKLKPPMADMVSNVAMLEKADRRRASFVVCERMGGESIEYTQMFIVASEFAAFMRSLDRDMIPALTTLFDGAISSDTVDYETQRGGSFSLLRPYPVILMGTTPEWLAERVPRNSRKGGFLHRFLFFYADNIYTSPFPQERMDVDKLLTQATKSYQAIAENRGEVDWSQEAKELYEEWYVSTRGGILAESESDLRAWTSRLGIFLVKLAGLSALSDHRHTITPDDLHFAWALMHYARHGALRADHATGASPDSWTELRIIQVLKEQNPLPGALLCQQLSHDASAQQVRRAIQTLASIGVLSYDKAFDHVKLNEETASAFLKEPTAKEYNLGWEQLKINL